MNLQPLFLYRLAGLPADVMSDFHAAELSDAAYALVHLERDIDASRTALRQIIYEAVPAVAEDRARYELLDLRRSLSTLEKTVRLADVRISALWPAAVTDALRALQERVAAYRVQANDYRHRFEEETVRMRTCFHAHLRNDSFRKGLLLSSESLTRGLAAYLKVGAKKLDRRQRRIEAALMAYVSRMALKTSPFSTFTFTGIGRWEEEPGGADLYPPALPAGKQVSHTRVNVTALLRVLEALKRSPAVSLALPVALNPTLTHTSEGLLQFYGIKPGCQFDEELTATWLRPTERLVNLRAHPALGWLQGALARGPRPLAELVSCLSRESGTPEHKVEAVALQLIDEGFLAHALPELGEDKGSERHLLQAFAAAGDPVTRAVVRCLDALLREVDSYADAPMPRRATVLRSIEKHLRQAERRAGVAPYRGPIFFEDATLGGERLRLNPNALAPNAGTLAALARVVSAFHPHHVERQRIAAFYRACWPAAPSVDLLVFYHAYASTQRRLGSEAFNHTYATGAAAVTAFQADLRSAITAAASHTAAGVRIDAGAVMAFWDRRPGVVSEPASATFFLQRGRSEGSPWKVNLSVEGYGKFFSRFAHLFPHEDTAELMAHLQHAASTGDEPSLSDIGVSFGTNVNLHRVYTPYVLGYPGYRLPRHTAREIPLRELRVRLTPSGLPELVWTRTGQRIHPVHLGFLVSTWLPSFPRFLLTFSPPKPMMIPWHELVLPGEMKSHTLPRIYFEDLLLYRQRWHILAEDLPRRTEALSDAEYYLSIQAWRSRWGVPDACFVTIDQITMNELGDDVAPPARERRNRDEMPGRVPETFKRKPQYIDFTSPLFLDRFAKLVDTSRLRITCEEIYPAPADLLVRHKDSSYVSEIVTEITCTGDRQPSFADSSVAVVASAIGQEALP